MSCVDVPIRCQSVLIGIGDIIEGRFGCRKSPTNSRELNVEIHYNVKGEEERTVQSYRVC